mmetsp:Transcript_27489/g.54995  ORF Transcript_27489/g.54995 Transcript_27489/m.54995 type:complete len:352 (-) Transcript_27489:85-1140(-)
MRRRLPLREPARVRRRTALLRRVRGRRLQRRGAGTGAPVFRGRRGGDQRDRGPGRRTVVPRLHPLLRATGGARRGPALHLRRADTADARRGGGGRDGAPVRPRAQLTDRARRPLPGGGVLHGPRLLDVGLPPPLRRLRLLPAPLGRRRQLCHRRHRLRHVHHGPRCRPPGPGRRRRRGVPPHLPPRGRGRRPLGARRPPDDRRGDLPHVLHGHDQQLRGHALPGATAGRRDRGVPPGHRHRSDGGRGRGRLRGRVRTDPALLLPGGDHRGGPGAPEHPGAPADGGGLPPRAAAALGAQSQRVPARRRLRERGRGAAGVHDQVRLQQRRPQSHRVHLQNGPRADAPVRRRPV